LIFKKEEDEKKNHIVDTNYENSIL